MPRGTQVAGPDVIPNQVFVGSPWHSIRPKYEKVIDNLKKQFPLSFVIIGRTGEQEARDLLAHIEEALLSSSFAIFDGTGGNPNVSLEFGFAEGWDIPRALYVSTHRASKAVSKDSPIIADLAGKTRNQYAQVGGLEKLLSAAARAHNYTKRFEQFLRNEFRKSNKGEKKRARALALKVIHALDGQTSRRRADMVQDLLTDPADYKEAEIDAMLRRLHQGGLVVSTPGRYSSVVIS